MAHPCRYPSLVVDDDYCLADDLFRALSGAAQRSSAPPSARFRSRTAGLVEGDGCEMPVTQEMLADALGLIGVHVNRTLQTLRDTGMVDHKGGRLFVPDFDRLRTRISIRPTTISAHSGRSFAERKATASFRTGAVAPR